MKTQKTKRDCEISAKKKEDDEKTNTFTKYDSQNK